MWHETKIGTAEFMCIKRHLNLLEVENETDKKMLEVWLERTEKKIVKDLNDD